MTPELSWNTPLVTHVRDVVELVEMLEARDVCDPTGIVLNLDQTARAAMPATVAWWDEQPQLGAGALVLAIRSGRTPTPRQRSERVERRAEDLAALDAVMGGGWT